ncbi:hypothetical protein MTR67_017598 [Solanum verrucosum]|uniref:Uncharacterized protein n=1 Tax=Solanum verrucosum TaxID=315347 RepID=A0AAF0QKR8_SOLVR|nr:hypothetical protein MTR67_017598 [Solanum verrucosum]
MNGFFSCGKSDHKVKDCLLQASKGKNGRKAQPSDFGLGAPCENRSYALKIRQDHEGSPNVIIEKGEFAAYQLKGVSHVRLTNGRKRERKNGHKVKDCPLQYTKIRMPRQDHEDSLNAVTALVKLKELKDKLKDLLKELKDELKDLLDKGFIRPNISLWGVSTLFAKKDLDPLLVELKNSVSEKSIEAFSHEKDTVLPYQGLGVKENLSYEAVPVRMLRIKEATSKKVLLEKTTS